MSLVFTAVELFAGEASTKFLIAGSLTGYESLHGWNAYEEFVNNIKTDDVLAVYGDVRCYGEGPETPATVEEVAYFYQRITDDPDFIESKTKRLYTCSF